MKVGIIEICEPNHYTSVCALADTYAHKGRNKVVIYTLSHIAGLFISSNRNIEVVVKADNISVSMYLTEISLTHYDRLHINTISGFFKEFAAIRWQANLYFTIHNIEQWYDNPLSSRTRLLISGLASSFSSRYKGNRLLPLILFVKDFKRQYYRYLFIKNLSLQKTYRIIVYSESQRKYLLKFVPNSNILVFPFCLNKGIKDKSFNNETLRICIPGSVSNVKRDYSGFFALLLNQANSFSFGLTIDLLGFMPKEDRVLLDSISRLKVLGIDVIFSLDFISDEEFDERLSLCDVILGNLRVRLNANQKYGETKETGVLFNVIKSGKPAILPQEYSVDEMLEPACLHYSDYKHLFTILQELANGHELLTSLKISARRLAEQYTPENLYPVLLN